MRIRSQPLMTITALLTGTAPAVAQTDYYNTDAGRPVLTEDAYPVERYAFEGQVAPLRMERSDDGAYHWEFEPELAYGVFPRTQIEAGVHLDFTDQEGTGRALGVEGFEVAILHNLNVETTTLPALAIAAEGVVPVGEGASGFFPSVKAIATRTLRQGRIHLNGQYTVGGEPDDGEGAGDLTRWMAGAAVDRAFPLRGALLIADIVVARPLAGGELEWTAEAGTRYQLDPFFALDMGVGRRLTGEHPAWFVTLGAARTFGIRSLMPRSVR